VRAICEAGTNIDAPLKVSPYGSLLADAACAVEGYDAMICLIRHGANVNLEVQNGDFGSALAAAAAMGADTMRQLDIVEYLVSQGAKIGMQLRYGCFGSALIAAAAFTDFRPLWEDKEDNKGFKRYDDENCEHYIKFVKYLVTKETDLVNELVLYGKYGSVLAAAAAVGALGCVKYLIQEGKAKINMPLCTGKYDSALAAAAYHGRIDTMKLLISEGASLKLDLGDGRVADAREAGEEVPENLKY
jgi:ankyrin repeat domain-containing protein 50